MLPHFIKESYNSIVRNCSSNSDIIIIVNFVIVFFSYHFSHQWTTITHLTSLSQVIFFPPIFFHVLADACYILFWEYSCSYLFPPDTVTKLLTLPPICSVWIWADKMRIWICMSSALICLTIINFFVLANYGPRWDNYFSLILFQSSFIFFWMIFFLLLWPLTSSCFSIAFSVMKTVVCFNPGSESIFVHSR